MIKKVTAVLLSVITAFMCMPLCVFALDDVYLVTAQDGLTAYSEPDVKSEQAAVVRRGACVSVSEKKNGFGHIVYDSIPCWIDLSSGLKKLTEPESVTGLKSLKIASLPEKLTYVDSEETFDASGLSVKAVFDDGSEKDADGYVMSVPPLTKPGKKTVVITYGGMSASFVITVTRIPVSSIEISSLPAKTEYLEGETVSLGGLKVTAKYSDGRPDAEVTDYEVSGVDTFSPAKPGRYTVTVKYKYNDITASFPITVESKSLKSLKIKSMPSNLSAYQYGKLDLSNITLVAEYDNGNVIETSDFTAEYDTSVPGTAVAKLYFDGKYAAFDFTVIPSEEQSMDIVPPEDSYSFIGDVPDFSEIKVYITYNSSVRSQTDEFDISSDIDINEPGAYRVTVKHGQFTAVFEHNVYKKYLGDINFDGRITGTDARAILRHAAKIENLTRPGEAVADINSDGRVSPADARSVLRISAKLETHPDDIKKT